MHLPARTKTSRLRNRRSLFDRCYGAWAYGRPRKSENEELEVGLRVVSTGSYGVLLLERMLDIRRFLVIMAIVHVLRGGTFLNALRKESHVQTSRTRHSLSRPSVGCILISAMRIRLSTPAQYTELFVIVLDMHAPCSVLTGCGVGIGRHVSPDRARRCNAGNNHDHFKSRTTSPIWSRKKHHYHTPYYGHHVEHLGSNGLLGRYVATVRHLEPARNPKRFSKIFPYIVSIKSSEESSAIVIFHPQQLWRNEATSARHHPTSRSHPPDF